MKLLVEVEYCAIFFYAEMKLKLLFDIKLISVIFITSKLSSYD